MPDTSVISTFAPAAVRQGAVTANSLSELGEGDFLRLLTVQLQQQDPFEPVDNSQMLAQMAQFTSLASATKSNDTLQQISDKLDALIAAQTLPTP
ncbi:flagellar hook assembly protein FlgD [Allopontixanthobacter sediminis]|uniref:Basal-body rod modification protein FlgD n=1 Tax=Allopontixanthobacter sediminis TaxID=1689985 RepID=A0A845B1Q2_9SPHN|nr:flagellar hook capping FlgD N-terminal domain-containing protein [Allopontixanthobacter sediminis]MXP45663.1 flagellar biosynthesis protein FlgD [Allopontixanthobacter sediminis]